MYALVDLLRGSRRPWSAARLSEEFEVSKRTIERDIQSLQLAGVPIYAEHGVSGGYSILREHSLPPLNLTVPESLAVLAGLGLLETSPYGAAARRVVRLGYSSEDGKTQTTRDVEAMGLLRGGDSWFRRPRSRGAGRGSVSVAHSAARMTLERHRVGESSTRLA